MKKNSIKNIFIAFILNLFFSIFEFFGGVFTNSVSIMSDAIHDFGDAISILISLILEKKATKDEDQDYTFGYLRYSILGALFTSTILLVGSVVIIFSAIKRIINPLEVDSDGMLLLAVIGVIINLIATKITSNSNNLNERTVSLHMFEDVLNWVCVLIGSIIIKFTNFYIIDPILSLLVAIFIFVNVFKKFKDIFDILLEKKPLKIDVSKIKQSLLEIQEVEDVHHLHIWTIDGITNYITLHVCVDGNILCRQLNEIRKQINHRLNELDISHSTIQFETNKCDNKKCVVNRKNIHNHMHNH